MAGEQSYYEILGVSPDASLQEITRAHARKRREHANDEEMTLLVIKAYEALRNPENREDIDINSKYGDRINELEEVLSKTESQEEYIKVIEQMKTVYLELLSEYSTSIYALSQMFRIERILGDDSEAEKYLLKLEKLIDTYESEKEKLDFISFLGKSHQEIGNTESAIKMYKQIYEVDVDRVKEVISLCRLVFESRKNSKVVLQVLNLCINKAKKAESKASYLCEALRFIEPYGEQSYNKVRQTLTKLLKELISKTDNPSLVAKSVFNAMVEAVDEKKIALFKLFHEIFESYNVDVPEINCAVVAMCQMVEVIEAGKLHEFVELYMANKWTDANRTKMGDLLWRHIDAIRESINYIKDNAPTYWDEEEETFKDLQEYINEIYPQVKEYRRIKNDSSIRRVLKEMLRILIVDGLVKYEMIKEEFETNRDAFFEELSKEEIQEQLYILERSYPICYKMFSDVFFEGKSTQELFGTVKQTQEVVNKNNDDDSDAIGCFCMIAVIVGIVLLFSNPLVGIVVIGFAYAGIKKCAEDDEKEKAKNIQNKSVQDEIVQDINMQEQTVISIQKANAGEVTMDSKQGLEYTKEHDSICLDRVMNKHLKRMIVLLYQYPFEEIKEEFEEEKEALFKEMNVGEIKRLLERLEVYYPLTHEKISELLQNKKNILNIVNTEKGQKKKQGCLMKVLKWFGFIFLFSVIGEILESIGIIG